MHYILSAAPLIAALFGIYLTSFYSYILFHSLAEGFSIVISCGIFMIAWNSRRLLQNHYLLFIGIAYLFVGGIDFLHTLSYKGMGVFEGVGANLPTQLWVAARYMEAFSLLAATVFLGRKLSHRRVFLAYSVATGLLLSSIFYWKIFPDCFVEGVGLTPFKIYSEYLICLILLAAIFCLIWKSKNFDRKVLILLLASIATAIAQGLAFTTYLSVYGPSNMIGHFLKIVSFYLVYKAIIETSLVAPCNLLFRDLKQSEAKFRSIFETNVVPIAYCHMGGQIIDANEHYLKLLGFSREELKAGTVRWDSAIPSDWKHMDEQVLEYLRRDGVCPPLEQEYMRRDGTRVPVLLGACLLPGDSEQVVAFALDLTERKLIEGELRKSRDELEQRVQERTAELMKVHEELKNRRDELAHVDRVAILAELASSMAHELRQPLTGVLTNAQAAKRLLSAEPPDLEEVGAALDDIIDDDLRARGVIENMRSLLRKQGSDQTAIDINAVVQDSIKLIATEAVKKRITIGADLASGLPRVIGNGIQLQQVLLNLILNSFDALARHEREERRITVCTAREDEKTLLVKVSDNGPGMDTESLGRVFESFFTTKPEGLGMGLPISRSIIEAHGGRLWAIRNSERGMTFCFTMPVGKAADS